MDRRLADRRAAGSVALLLLLLLTPASNPRAAVRTPLDPSGASVDRGVILTAGNAWYRIRIQASRGHGVGLVGVATGPEHPSGPGIPLLNGDGSPGASFTTVRSRTTGVDYVQGSSPPAGVGHVVALDPYGVVTPIGSTGFRTTYVLPGPPRTPDRLTIVQDVAARGDALDNAGVVVSTTAINRGGGPVRIAIRDALDVRTAAGDGRAYRLADPAQAAFDRPQVFDLPDFRSFALDAVPGSTGHPGLSLVGLLGGPDSTGPPGRTPDRVRFSSWAWAREVAFDDAAPNRDVAARPSESSPAGRSADSQGPGAVVVYFGAADRDSISVPPNESATASIILLGAPAQDAAACTVKILNPPLVVCARMSAAVAASGSPAGGTFTWSSSDTTVAMIGASGRSTTLTGVAPGTATITVTYTTDKGACTDTAPATVLSVSVQPKTALLCVTEKQGLTALAGPAGGNFKWSSSDPKVALVAGNGPTAVVQGATLGTATITVSYIKDGKECIDTCVVTVIGVAIQQKTLVVCKGMAGMVTAVAAPAGGTFNWSSSNPGVATVAGNGATATVTGVQPGSTTLTVTYTFNGKTCPSATAATAFVVALQVTSVTFSNDRTVLQDNGAAYVRPQWLDKDGNGVATDIGDSNFPVCYVRNTPMTVSASFVVMPAGFDRKVLIRGTDLDKQVVTPGGGAAVYPATTTSTNLPDQIDLLNPKIIIWEMSTDDGASWCPIGTSQHRIYVTLATPTAPKLYETILDIGCRNAKGQTTDANAVKEIWKDFAQGVLEVPVPIGPPSPPPGVKRKPIDGFNKPDGVGMGYWLGGVAGGCNELKDMLVAANGNGTCQAWSQLLHQTLKAQGIAGSQIFQVTANAAVNANSDGFLVKNWKFGKHIRTGANGINDSDTVGDDFTSVMKGKGYPNLVCIKAAAGMPLATAPKGDDKKVGNTITTGANGICETTAAGTDVQVVPVGQGAPNTPCITPGPNAKLDSTPGGDDMAVEGLFAGELYPFVVFAPFADAFNQPGVAGQKNPEPPPAFHNHYVVKYPVVGAGEAPIYDPSYGTGPFATQQAHEDASIDGIYAKTIMGITAAKKHDKLKELKYTRAAFFE